MKRWIRNNSLSMFMLGGFFVFQIGLSLAGYRQYNQEQEQHRQPQVTYTEYLLSGHFIEATMENWESEFLQMFAYVLLTSFLFQKGSAESKKIDKTEDVDRDPRGSRSKRGVPWPVRRGGVLLILYENSLSAALFLLFAVSFLLHAAAGAKVHSLQEVAHGGSPVSTLQYATTSRFWFESFQNWQSEFFSVGILVLLSIVLRQRGSPESKPVDAPHALTGSE